MAIFYSDILLYAIGVDVWSNTELTHNIVKTFYGLPYLLPNFNDKFRKGIHQRRNQCSDDGVCLRFTVNVVIDRHCCVHICNVINICIVTDMK